MGDPLTITRIRNPDASAGLELVISLETNTSSEVVNNNIRHNAALDLPWLEPVPEHNGVAIIVGGGPSAADHLDAIRGIRGDLFALNGASKWLASHDIIADYQVIIDARPENIGLVDHAVKHIFASQCDPSLMYVGPTLIHLMSEGIVDLLPKDRGFRLLGGGYGVGNTAICAAYTMGYRTIHCFGFDSSHRDGRGHAYSQPMNDKDILVDTEWDGKVYTSSVTMKAHAERFQMIASDLEGVGCKIHVHGDGLLPAMWRLRGKQITEGSKYRLLWSTASYREYSPGEQLVEKFNALIPTSSIIDFGCGTGRAGLALSRKGHDVTLVDFAENCRDPATYVLPFVEHDLTQPLHHRADYGFCADVLEHIPPEDVDVVIENIMGASDKGAFFQISTAPDSAGALIGHQLHLTVQPHEWWRQKFEGYHISFQEMSPNESQFFVNKE